MPIDSIKCQLEQERARAGRMAALFQEQVVLLYNRLSANVVAL